MKKNIKITKKEEYEIQLEMVDNECTRLRRMLEELLHTKNEGNPPGYNELEKQLLDKTVTIKDLQKTNKELMAELENSRKEYEGLLQRMQEADDQPFKTYDTIKQNQIMEEYKEKFNETSGMEIFC